MRGVPGSGKSSLANEIANSWGEGGFSTNICSADKYFMKNGQYFFDVTKLSSAHQSCKDEFLDCIKNEWNIIIVDNTNTQHKEYKFYKDEAVKAGYEVQVITVGEFSEEAIDKYAARNTHGVPRDKIKQMRDRFQL
jgi:tRNA uridine 5-carbamoylmethylation protein Kti12